jgi:hypothetical protein
MELLGSGQLVGGAGSGELGATGLHDGLEFHELDAGAIGIVEVGLPLAVFAHLRAVVSGREAVLLIEGLDGLLLVGDAEGEVVEDAELVGVHAVNGGIRAVADHHVFEPVVAVGDLERDPVDVVGLHGSEPVGTEAEDVAIEVVFGGAAMDEIADVDDSGADGFGCDGGVMSDAGLDELDFVALGVFGVEPVAAIGGGVEVGGGVNAVGVEIGEKTLGVGGVEGDAGHAAEGVVGGEGKNFYELRGAEVVESAGRILRVGGLGRAEDVGVEVVGGGEVVGVDTHVGDARDGRALLLGEGAGGGEGGEQSERKSLGE